MSAATTTAPARVAPPKPSRKSTFLRQIILWHWVSSGVCLGAMLLFTITGITLNHAAEIPATPVITKDQAEVPSHVRSALSAEKRSGKHPLPPAAVAWTESRFGSLAMSEGAEWSDDEVYISLPRPGGDAWITIDRETGVASYERTDRGWISYFNDLHKGRHTGVAWQVFIDVIAVAFLIFTATGVVLLQTHAAKRPSTWPLVALGLIGPTALLILFVHR